MGVDGGKVEFAGDEEEHCFHSLEAGVSARLSFGGLEQSIDGFDEAVGVARSGPGDDAVEMIADHGGDLLHGLDLGAHDVGAPLSQHGGNDVELPAVEDIAQLLAIEPGAGSALGGELETRRSRSWAWSRESLLLSLSKAQRKPLSAGSVLCSMRRILSTAWLA